MRLDADPAGRGVGHRGLDESGCNGVDIDAERPEFDGQRPGEPLDSGLCGRVVGLAAVAECRDRAQIDDLARFLLDHDLLGGP